MLNPFIILIVFFIFFSDICAANQMRQTYDAERDPFRARFADVDICFRC